MLRCDTRSGRSSLVTFAALTAAALSASAALAQPGGGGQVRLSPQAGSARPWEAGMQVARHSVVNLYNGNMLTVIPIFSCDPVGPVLEFTLYHNSASAGSSSSAPAPWGFDLGGGWSVSYGAMLIEDQFSNDVTLVEDDGNQWIFDENSGDYIAPAGRYDILEKDTPQTGEWTLRGRDQTLRIFNSDGFLIKVIDSAGNTLEIVRDVNDRLDYIKSAADGLTGVGDHRIEFEYDQTLTDKLVKITDVLEREYTFEYFTGTKKRLKKITFPKDSQSTTNIQFTYDSSNHIESCTDQLGSVWQFDYTGDALTLVTDPAVNSVSNTQELEYPGTQVNSLWRTIYTDRRTQDWEFRFDNSGNFREQIDPLTNTRTYTYDSDHKRLTFTNELSKTWTMTYGTNGTLETLTSPLNVNPAQTWNYEWEHNVNSIANFSRLTQISDPAGHWMEYDYTDTNDPTNVTLVTETPAEQNGAEAETVLEYYDTNTPKANGQLLSVTDANGVRHEFAYDKWGYYAGVTEGLWVADAYEHPVEQTAGNDAAGRATSGGDAGGSGTMGYNYCDDPTGASCAMMSGPPGTPRLGSTPAYGIEPMVTCSTGNTYNNVHQPTLLNADCLSNFFSANTRKHTFEYDALGRMTEHAIESDEHAPWNFGTYTTSAFQRTFDNYDYDAEGRVLAFTGPDSNVVKRTYDELGNLYTVDYDGDGTADLTNHYDDASRLEQIDYPNGVVAYYDYDDANRLLEISYQDGTQNVLFELDYTWSLNNLVTQRVEYDGLTSQTSTVTFDYDDRNHLISEERTGQNPYDLSYTYDQLGNRLTKTDATNQNNVVVTAYYYDTDPNNRPQGYETNNNRLLWYEVWTDFQTEQPVLARTVNYIYYETGHVSNITIEDETNPAHFYDLALYYARNGVLWLAAWSEYDIIEGEVENYVVSGAREFRYDNPRQRYMVRDILTPTADPYHETNPWSPSSTWTYTDYEDLLPYADSTVVNNSGTAAFTQLSRYQTGLGILARQNIDQGQVDTTTHLHGDLIRSTNLTTDDAGDGVSTVTYTAFGELLGASGPGSPAPTGSPRYQYAGGFGYEADFLALEGHDTSLAPVTLQHLGARWYDPGLGRFIMRDPIGIFGDRNVYLYAAACPTPFVDPMGLDLIGSGFTDCFTNTLAEGWRWVLGDKYLSQASDGELVAIAVGTSTAITVAGTVATVATAAEGSVALGITTRGTMVVRSSGAWLVHMGGRPIPLTSPNIFLRVWCPARFPNAIYGPVPAFGNCWIGALRAFLGAL